jgi:hypothetical protein
MRTNAAIVVGLVSLAGCGGVELEAPGVDGGAGLEPISSMREALSGSRLRVRYVEGDDGSRITAGFYDTARNEPCSFGPAEDGRLRCLPTEDLVTVLPGVFADPLCSQRLAVGPCAFPPLRPRVELDVSSAVGPVQRGTRRARGPLHGHGWIVRVDPSGSERVLLADHWRGRG